MDRVVRSGVEKMLSALLDAEVDRLCNAQRYERGESRRDTLADNEDGAYEGACEHWLRSDPNCGLAQFRQLFEFDARASSHASPHPRPGTVSVADGVH